MVTGIRIKTEFGVEQALYLFYAALPFEVEVCQSRARLGLSLRLNKDLEAK
jgi:hypothetical protein